MSYTVDARAWQVTAAPGGWVRLVAGQISNGTFGGDADRQPVIYLRVVKDASGVRSIRETATVSPDPIGTAMWRDVPFDMAMLFARDIEEQVAPPPLHALNEIPWEPEQTVVLGAGVPSGKLATLKVPEAGLTDDFLTQLSTAYRELVAAKRAPAPAIAEQTGRPVGTVHRWIAEARKRGHLPPARQGRAG